MYTYGVGVYGMNVLILEEVMDSVTCLISV
jgi:hypothetical protein